VSEKHRITSSNARQVWEWLQNRGGIAIWKSINLSNPGASWLCPFHDENGRQKGKPTWQAESQPSRIITDPAEVVVDVPKEVRRFYVAVRMGGNGLSLKLTDGATRRVRAAVDKANIAYAKERGLDPDDVQEAWYEFDYETQEAVILVPDSTQPIEDYLLANTE